MIWIKKVKAMGSCALDSIEGGRGSAEKRVIFAEVANVSMFKGVNKATSNPPIVVISSNVGTLGNGGGNRG